MGEKIKSISRSASATESSIQSAERISSAVKTRAVNAPQDITDSSKRRLVVGKGSLFPTPHGGPIGMEAILGVDERTRIVSTTTAPWKYVCALDIDAPLGRFIGTAWAVAPRTLITAGHCVFDAIQMGGWAREIFVTPGQDREIKPFGTSKVVKFSTTELWHQNQDADFDIAALHLDEPLFAEGECFQVGAFPDADLRGFLVNVSGYPGTPGNGQEQWWAKNRVREVSVRRIFYDVDTSGGQSGGPAYIFQEENGPPIVVGIHAYGTGGTPASIPMQVNSAPRIIPEVVERIQGWIDNGPDAVS